MVGSDSDGGVKDGVGGSDGGGGDGSDGGGGNGSDDGSDSGSSGCSASGGGVYLFMLVESRLIIYSLIVTSL